MQGEFMKFRKKLWNNGYLTMCYSLVPPFAKSKGLGKYKYRISSTAEIPIKALPLITVYELSAVILVSLSCESMTSVQGSFSRDQVADAIK